MQRRLCKQIIVETLASFAHVRHRLHAMMGNDYSQVSDRENVFVWSGSLAVLCCWFMFSRSGDSGGLHVLCMSMLLSRDPMYLWTGPYSGTWMFFSFFGPELELELEM